MYENLEWLKFNLDVSRTERHSRAREASDVERRRAIDRSVGTVETVGGRALSAWVSNENVRVRRYDERKRKTPAGTFVRSFVEDLIRRLTEEARAYDLPRGRGGRLSLKRDGGRGVDSG